MKFFNYNTDDKIVALATPYVNGALGVIRCSGEGSVEAVTQCFSSNALLKSQGYRVHYGHIIDPDSKQKLDEVLCTVFRAPKSYTGEESVEISCHGSLPGLESILKAMRKVGFRDAGPGEFTLRAFLNGKLDLSRAEAVNEIVNAKTAQAHQLALNRLSGSIEEYITEQKEHVIELMSQAAVQLDYPDEELDESVFFDTEKLEKVIGNLQSLANSYEVGKLFQLGIDAALAGATNAGKSSLFNLFTKEDRSIVSDTHGTTRDYIEANLTLRGIPVRLFDTAGLRESEDHIEKEGIRRSERIIENSALILYIVDSVVGLSQADKDIFSREKDNTKYIFIWNKIDKSSADVPNGFFPISAITGDGFHPLEEEMVKRITHGSGIRSDIVIDSQRQHELLEKALEALLYVKNGYNEGYPLDAVATDLQDVLDALGELTGEVSSEDILNKMFSDFCVGK